MPTFTIWHIPYQRNPYFTGREDVLSQLHRSLHVENAVALSHPHGISGLGGIGKTQIALEYAYRYCSNYTSILWVRADSVPALTSSLVELAHVLELPERREKEEEIIIQAVLRWLRVHVGWLLIYDNIENLSVVEPFLPKAGAGHLLFTTRASSTGGFALRLDIQKMEPETGALFLLRRSDMITLDALLDAANPDDQSFARAISREVDGLPLALDQAGTYIKEAPCPLSEYLARYQTRRSDLLRERGSFDQDYPASVATTWSLSFENILQASPASADLLNFCSFLAPDGIAETMIIKGAPYLPLQLQETVVHPLQFDQAIATLRAYSLIGRNLDETLSIHRLVQTVLHDAMPIEEKRQWKQRTVLTVNAASPNVGDVTQWDTCEQWVPHALVCAAWIDEEQIENEEAAILLNQAGYYLQERARYSETESLFVQALAIREHRSGPQHPATAMSLANLAQNYRNLRKRDLAKPLFIKALAILEGKAATDDISKILERIFELANFNRISEWKSEIEDQYVVTVLNNFAGLCIEEKEYELAQKLYEAALLIYGQLLRPPDLPSDMAYIPADNDLIFARAMNNMGELSRIQGQYDSAETQYKAALEAFEETVGPKHYMLAYSLHNLALVYREQRRNEEAEPLFERALAIREEHLGWEHPHTVETLNNLVAIYTSRGKFEQVGPLWARLLESYEQSLRSEYPVTGHTLSNLAAYYKYQGKFTQAESLYLRALAINEQRLDAVHPDVAASLKNLADLYGSQGRYAEAEPLLKRVLFIFEEQLGATHPEVATSLNNLAFIQKSQGRYTEAEPLYQRALLISEEQLGATHPKTATSLNNLAELYRAQGRYAEAEPLYQRALLISEEQLGATHPETATCLNNLAALYESQGRYAEAEQLLTRALFIHEEQLGATHPTTALTLNNLGTLYHAQEKYVEAEPLLLRALEINKQQLDPNHPSVAISLNNLAELYERWGRYAEAETLVQQVLSIREQTSGPNHPDLAETLDKRARILTKQGKYEEAEILYKRVLAIREQSLNAHQPDLADSFISLARFYKQQKKYEEAEPLLERGVLILEATSGLMHSFTMENINDLMSIYQILGKYQHVMTFMPLLSRRSEEAIEIQDFSLSLRALLYWKQKEYVQARALYEQVFMACKQKGDVLAAAYTLGILSIICKAHGDVERAVDYDQRSLTLQEQVFGEEHPKIIPTLNALVALYEEQEQYKEAEQGYLQLISLLEKEHGQEHPEIDRAVFALANLYQKQNMYEQAEQLYLRSLHIWENALGSQHPDVVSLLFLLVNFYQNQHRYAQAEEFYQRALIVFMYTGKGKQTYQYQAPIFQAYIAFLRNAEREEDARNVEELAQIFDSIDA